MTTDTRSPMSPADCARFDAQLGAWLEQDLDATEHTWMTQHRAACAACAAIVADLEQLVADAAALPPLTPPRDLWQDIEARLAAPVIPLHRGAAMPDIAAAHAARPTRTITVRRFAIAATMLVAVSSGVTWQLARRGANAGDTPRDANATQMAQQATGPAAGNTTYTDDQSSGMTALAVGSPTPRAATVARVRREQDDNIADVDATYEREITALRHIVDERFAELDTSTVTELRRNLDIIDRAIADSKAALLNDPRSALLSSQLDRALQAKLELLRRVALL